MIPRGSRDLAGAKCGLRRELEAGLMALYASRGYEEISTPTLEYYELFTACDNAIALDSAYKLIDGDGGILVLRPDLTVPASRLVATRLRDARPPLRLCYSAPVFRRQSRGGVRTELAQSGVELVGAGGIRADAEIILMAADALERAGVKDYKIELGHAGIFKSLAASMNLDEDTYETMRQHIEKKNYAALSALLAGLDGQRAAAAAVMARLPRLFGGREVLAQAGGLIADPAALSVLDYLDRLMSVIESAGLDGQFMVDLGLVQHIDYYTGVVFRGYIGGAGAPVLSGGRYDNLYGRLTSPMPAAGFAVMLDEVADAREKSGGYAVRRPDIMIHYEDGYAGHAREIAGKTDGICMISTFDTVGQSAADARQRGIARLVIIDEQGAREVAV